MSGQKEPLQEQFVQCEPCGKRLYGSRKAARKAARVANRGHMQPYRCEVSDGWHIGHIPRDVGNGTIGKDEWVRRRR